LTVAAQFIDRMAVEVDGDGDAVVCVHGLGGTTNTWTPLLPALSRHRVVRIELPGCGRSQRAYALAETAPGKGKLSVGAFVEAVLRVCGALGIRRAHFAGHSMGTIVCQHLAVREPSMARSLLLFGALAAPPEPAREGLRKRAALARSDGMFPIADSLVQAALSAHTRETQPVTVAMLRESLLAQEPEGYARCCEALAAAEAARLEDIACPVLLVAGEEDAVAPAQTARAMAAKLARARVETLPRCGHWMTFERAAECQQFAREFLSRVK
jgi:pimeloyl-ACP methyl ester carboxylesterase